MTFLETGSGYSTACLSRLAGPNTRILGIDNKLEAFNYAESRLKEWNFNALINQQIQLRGSDVLGGEVPLIDIRVFTRMYQFVAGHPHRVGLKLGLKRPLAN